MAVTKKTSDDTPVDRTDDRPEMVVPVPLASDSTAEKARVVAADVNAKLEAGAKSPNLPDGEPIPTAAVANPQPPHPLAPLGARPNPDDTPNSEARRAVEDKANKRGNFAPEVTGER